MMRAVAVVLGLLGSTALSVTLPNGLGMTPQMGWNSWNKFGCGIDQDMIREIMDAIVSSGLQDVGYEYVNLDDCWQSAREDNGTIIPDPDNFPDGITPLVDYAHSKGLLFGLYSDAGYYTCAGRPGSLGYETIDANTYAQWEVDYLKYDNCNTDGSKPEERYPVMRDALNATGRPIFFSMCEWGVDDPWNWAPDVGNSWRTTGDISDNWNSMIGNWDNNGPASAAGPGAWNDPDMLEVGNGGMTTTEYKTHFSLWCIGKAPLLTGCDPRQMSDETKEILFNKEAIAVNQDVLGVQSSLVARYGVRYGEDQQQVYAAPMENGVYAVAFLNRASRQSADIQVTWSQLGLNSGTAYTVRDLWEHLDMGTAKDSYTAAGVPAHGTMFVTLTPQ